MNNELNWGPVLVARGRHKGRITNYDDEERDLGICYFGFLTLYARQADIPIKYLAHVTTTDLWKRKEAIYSLISPCRISKKKLTDFDKLDLLHEYHYIYWVLEERWEHARHKHQGNGRRVFISHSSKNKEFARWLAVDLGNLGHHPWLDEWQIKAGESIPSKIADGLKSSDVVILILSPDAVASGWVEREWQARYWDEVSSGKVVVIPVLIEQCDIPLLLRPKKYADFTKDHRHGFEELIEALSPTQKSPSEIDKLSRMMSLELQDSLK